jgi:glycosyltransferase involved in cell wall biosynthesis
VTHGRGPSPDGRKIRVAHLIHTMLYGGVETAVLNWLRTMDKSRFEVHLFCFANPGGTEMPFVEAASACGFDVERIPWSRRKPILGAARAMARHVRAREIDILHCHNTYAQLVAVAASWLTNVRTITTLYVWGDFGWKRNMLQWADRLSVPFLDRVSAHCERTFAETVRRGFPAGRLCLLTCGFEAKPVEFAPQERARRRRELDARDGDTVLLHVARFWPEKAHDVLLDGFCRILERKPNTRLWLAGVGPEEARIRALSEELGVAANTRFLGFRKDLPELLALADIQVHPSDMEGVPLAVCAGMAAGLPIVATAVGGVVEVLRDDHSALLVAPRSPEQFAGAVLRLIDDPDKGRRLGATARRFVEQKYSLAAATARVEAVYEEMLTA